VYKVTKAAVQTCFAILGYSSAGTVTLSLKKTPEFPLVDAVLKYYMKRKK
jgi:hypothetical protein